MVPSRLLWLTRGTFFLDGGDGRGESRGSRDQEGSRAEQSRERESERESTHSQGGRTPTSPLPLLKDLQEQETDSVAQSFDFGTSQRLARQTAHQSHRDQGWMPSCITARPTASSPHLTSDHCPKPEEIWRPSWGGSKLGQSSQINILFAGLWRTHCPEGASGEELRARPLGGGGLGWVFLEWVLLHNLHSWPNS